MLKPSKLILTRFFGESITGGGVIHIYCLKQQFLDFRLSDYQGFQRFAYI